MPNEIKTQTIHNIIKNQTDKNVSPEAAEDLAQEIQCYALERSDEIVMNAEEDNRSTIKPVDVKETK